MRAAEGGTTLTELADHLVREHGIPFASAHSIAARMLKEQSVSSPESLAAILERVSGELLGTPLRYDEPVLAAILSARHFVGVRRTPGGPAPDETRRAVAESRQALERDRTWLQDTRVRLSAAESRLRERSQAL